MSLELTLGFLGFSEESKLDSVSLSSSCLGFSLHLLFKGNSVESSLLGFPGGSLDDLIGSSLGLMKFVFSGGFLSSSFGDCTSLHTLSFVHVVD